MERIGDKFKELFDALPKNTKDLVDYLKRNKIKGFRGVASSCPLSNYYRRNGCIVSVEDRISKPDFDEKKKQANTEAMKEFIAFFDRGNFPELVINENYMMIMNNIEESRRAREASKFGTVPIPANFFKIKVNERVT